MKILTGSLGGKRGPGYMLSRSSPNKEATRKQLTSQVRQAQDIMYHM